MKLNHDDIERIRAHVNTQITDESTRIALHRMINAWGSATGPVPIRLNCPECGELHVDEGEFATRPHHTHACQHCGAVWRPAIFETVGVRFLPGFKNS